jgi:hypothetical protein
MISAHALRRARERLGLALTEADFGSVYRAFFSRQSMPVLCDPFRGQQIWLIPLKGVLAGIVLKRDSTTRQWIVATFLTPAQARAAAWRQPPPTLADLMEGEPSR